MIEKKVKPATAVKSVDKTGSAATAKSARKPSAANRAPTKVTAKAPKPAPTGKTTTTTPKSRAPKKSPSPASSKVAKPTPEERYRMVATAAYFIAEHHGFQGRSDEHWAAAEREIAKMLGA